MNTVRNEFISTQRGDTIYDFVENIEPTQMFYYVCIIVGILFIFQFLQINLTHVTALIISIALIAYFNMQDKRKYETRMNDLYFKLQLIDPKPTYFYMDSDIIELIDDIKEYREYNIVAYSKMIYALDNFLEIVHDMELGVKDFGDNIEVAQHQQQIAIDNLQSVLFKLPVNRKLEYKLEQAIYSMKFILQRHIDKMIHILNKDIEDNGYNTRTKIFYFDQPRPMNPEKGREYLNYQ
jgi:hypothetical protein